MKKVITYGTYDLFHQGHYNLLKRAKALGDYLIVGVTTDSFDLERVKMNTCNNVMERIEAVKSTGLADQIVIEEYRGQKIDDIQKYGVDIFAIGSDWVEAHSVKGILPTNLRKTRDSPAAARPVFQGNVDSVYNGVERKKAKGHPFALIWGKICNI